MKKKNFFISFEGIDGSGKSTQVEILRNLNLVNMHCTCPGRQEESKLIRSLLLDKSNDWDVNTEILIHTASRNELVAKIIRPKLEQGYHVICDRYLDSTVAYQAYGNNQDPSLIINLHQMLMGDMLPDLTFILDLDPKISMQRIELRAGKTDRYEQKSLEFHQRVREGFLDIAQKNPQRCVVIDSMLDKKEIAQIIAKNLSDKFGLELNI